MLTCEAVLAQAAEAEREANGLWAKIEAARDTFPCDRLGNRPLTPRGFEADAQRASDLMRRARVLTAEADEMRAEAAAAAPSPQPNNSDSAVPGTRLVTSAPKKPGAAETVDAIAARILGS